MPLNIDAFLAWVFTTSARKQLFAKCVRCPAHAPNRKTKYAHKCAGRDASMWLKPRFGSRRMHKEYHGICIRGWGGK